MDVSRRKLLTGAAAGSIGTAVTGGLLASGARPDAEAADASTPAQATWVPFHGPHQAGILTPSAQQRYSTHAALDVTATGGAGLEALFQAITSRARFLTAGGTPAGTGTVAGAPPADNGVLGPGVPPDGLTVTLSAGASLFGERFGLAGRKPRLLTQMTAFPNDDLDPAWCHGDLLLQLCANNPDTVHHALRDIARHTRGAMQPRFRIDGFISPPRPAGASRNLMGFKDGISQPKGGQLGRLTWVGPASGEPAWAEGGSYHVLRLIRMLTEFWDRVSISEQQNMFGRFRDSGATLDSATGDENMPPDYPADPHGSVIPLDSHIRLANPRTAATSGSRFIRRGYNYDLGYDENGDVSCGLIFACFQENVRRQFETVQTRLINEPLTDYIQPFGGGYYFALPGVRDASDYYGRGLFS